MSWPAGWGAVDTACQHPEPSVHPNRCVSVRRLPTARVRTGRWCSPADRRSTPLLPARPDHPPTGRRGSMPGSLHGRDRRLGLGDRRHGCRHRIWGSEVRAPASADTASVSVPGSVGRAGGTALVWVPDRRGGLGVRLGPGCGIAAEVAERAPGWRDRTGSHMGSRFPGRNDREPSTDAPNCVCSDGDAVVQSSGIVNTDNRLRRVDSSTSPTVPRRRDDRAILGRRVVLQLNITFEGTVGE